MALIALPAGALLAVLRTMDAEPAHVAGLALLIVCGVTVLRQAAAASRSTSSKRRSMLEPSRSTSAP